MLTLFSTDGCPYAHRTRALLARLEQPFELKPVDLANKSAEFLAVTPNGKVPLLLDGALKLYESYVINHYLSEKLGWAGALSPDAGVRARQRLAMLQFDEVFAANFFKHFGQSALDEAAAKSVRAFLAELETTLQATSGTDNLVGLHIGPHWLRMNWLREDSPVAALVDERPTVRRWFDEAASLPAVQQTAPEREATVKALRARFGKRPA